MSKPKYDYNLVTDEVFQRWVKDVTWSTGEAISEVDARLVNAARVPEPTVAEPTVAELEDGLLAHIRECHTSTYPSRRAWVKSLVDKMRELQEAYTREAEEKNDE